MDRTPRRRGSIPWVEWFRLRNLFLLVAVFAGGGVAFGAVVDLILRRRVQMEIATRSRGAMGENLWVSFYPTVIIATVLLALVVAVGLFLLFRILTARLNRGSVRLERRLERLYRGEEGGGAAPHPAVISELGHLEEGNLRLVRASRRRWESAAVKAGKVSQAAGALEGEADPFRRLLLLRRVEALAVSLQESCRPRGREEE